MWCHKLPNKPLTATSPQTSVQYAATVQGVDEQVPVAQFSADKLTGYWR
jgi:hypothetical protein